MGKASRRDRTESGDVRPPDQGRSWFLPVVLGVVAVGAIAIGLLATQRESNVGVPPVLNGPGIPGDHWHTAFAVYACDTFLPPSSNQVDPEGIHTHGDGLIHVHPFATSATGNNATLEAYFRATGATLTDDTYTPGPGEVPVVLSESEGCNGEPATLHLAYWENAFQDEPTRIITTDLAAFKFERDGDALTLALVPEGTTIPKSPLVENVNNPGDL